jgi:CheY-like chemotaxis protein
MSEDFVRHNIYLPFSQQDPVASGMGLGLSLVKRNIESLGGSVDIETDQDLGTTANISIETENLLTKADPHRETDDEGQSPVGVIPFLPKQEKEDLPFMHACFYAPSTWLHRYDKRDQRSIDLMFDSLSATLSEWYQPVLSLWQHKTSSTPDLIFISQHNLAQFQEEAGDAFANVKKVVICAAIGKNSSQDREKIREASKVADALITGAVLPSKLWEVVTGYFPHILQPGTSSRTQLRNDEGDVVRSSSKEAVGEHDGDHDSSSKSSAQEHDAEDERSSHDDEDGQVPDEEKDQDSDDNTEQATAVDSTTDQKKYVDAGADPTSEDENATNRLSKTMTVPAIDTGKTPLKRNLTVPIFQGSTQPRMLLVDDNNLNLKMLGMFVTKSGILASQSTSVPGGQEAIDAFKEKNSTSERFDIVLMDLSMPEVSGFDATSAIREIEEASGHDQRAYIVALTGLVSDKDRNAAYEAGVDDYVTKPAGMDKVRNIIDTWQRRRIASDG